VLSLLLAPFNGIPVQYTSFFAAMSKKNKLKTRANAHQNDLKSEPRIPNCVADTGECIINDDVWLTVGEKEIMKKSKDAVQKSKDPAKAQVKAIKSMAKRQRRALLKKGVKYEVGFSVCVKEKVTHF
jgi:hypothetical protein